MSDPKSDLSPAQAIPSPTQPPSSSLILPVPLYPDPIPSVIPFGSLTMFAGATGAGKTTMAVGTWLKAWLDGGSIGPWAVPAIDSIGWVTSDRGGSETKQWFTKAGIEIERIAYYGVVDDPAFPIGKLSTRNANPAAISEAFRYCLSKLGLKPGALVMFDPVTPLFVMGDSNKARDVAYTMLQYSRICRELQITIILLGHFGKQRAKAEDRYARPQDRIAGSNAFGGYTSTQIYLLDPEPDVPYWQLGFVPRHCAPSTYQFTRNEHGLFIPYGEAPVVGGSQLIAQAPQVEGDARRQLVLSVIPPIPTRFAELLPQLLALGITQSSAYRYKQQLILQGLIRDHADRKVSRVVPS